MKSFLPSGARRALFVGLGLGLAGAGSVFAQSINFQIKVDQLGYRPNSTKFVIFGDSTTGQAADSSYVPGGTFTIRRLSDNVQVWPASGTATAAVQNGGSAVEDAGEIVYRGDFSAFKTAGTYYVYDPVRNKRSPKFTIGDAVYNEALKHAQRAFFYQRSNVAISSARGGAWNRAVSHDQQKTAQFYDTQARGDAKDLSGGWYDAGDFNKYVTFAAAPVWWLLQAVEAHPSSFGDANNIPESGNSRKDLLDEVKVELDWLLKMQETRSGNANFGGVYNILGSINGQPAVWGDPTKDTAPYYYSSVTSWATAAAAANFAHGARVFSSIDSTYSGKLKTAAERAWTWLEGKTSMTPSSGWDTSNGVIGSGDSTGLGGDDLRFRIWAAAELWSLTGTTKYHTYFKNNHADKAAQEGDHHPWHASSFEHSRCQELFYAYMSYALSSRSGKDSTIVDTVKTCLRVEAEASVDRYEGTPYRYPNEWSHNYWGSNASRSRAGSQLLFAVRLGVNQQSGARFTDAKFKEVAEEMLHYLHGRNALGYMYLTNMGSKGANLVEGRTPVELYHAWFSQGSKYDGISGSNIGPAPGFLAGGPAKYEYDYFGSGDDSKIKLSPPANEPVDKAYLDSNTLVSSGKDPGTYVFNEPGIYYQAPYIYLLSGFTKAL